MKAAQNLVQNLDFSPGKISLSSTYVQAAAIVILLFLLVLMLAQLRRHFVDWSVKGAMFGLFFGFLLALILEGFLIIGGKTAITEVLGWKNAPKPIANALDAGREKLVNVLGISSEIPVSEAKSSSSSSEFIKYFQSLAPDEAEKAKAMICQP